MTYFCLSVEFPPKICAEYYTNFIVYDLFPKLIFSAIHFIKSNETLRNG